MEHCGYKLIFRRYASLYFIVGADIDEVAASWGGKRVDEG